MTRGRHPRHWRLAGRIAFALFLVLVGVLLVRYARGVDWPAVRAALTAYGGRALLTVVGLTVATYLVYGCYDLARSRHA